MKCLLRRRLAPSRYCTAATSGSKRRRPPGEKPVPVKSEAGTRGRHFSGNTLQPKLGGRVGGEGHGRGVGGGAARAPTREDSLPCGVSPGLRPAPVTPSQPAWAAAATREARGPNHPGTTAPSAGVSRAEKKGHSELLWPLPRSVPRWPEGWTGITVPRLRPPFETLWLLFPASGHLPGALSLLHRCLDSWGNS